MKTIRNFIAAALAGLLMVTATVPVTAASNQYKVVLSSPCDNGTVCGFDLSNMSDLCGTPCVDLCDLLRQAGLCGLSGIDCITGCTTACDTDCTSGCDTDCTSDCGDCVITPERPTEIVIVPPTQPQTATPVKPTEAPTAPPTVTPTEAPAATEATDAPEVSALSAYEQEVVALTNRYRAQYGLQPLKADEQLSSVARLKSQDMRDKGYFDHNSPTYGSPFDMMKRFSVSYRTAGENIAMGYRTPESVVEGWMNSPGHRANILNASFTKIGVGYVASGNYWTQMFIG